MRPRLPERSDAEFSSHGIRCAAWHYRGDGDELSSASGRPCVVMAHGFGGTRDSGMEPFAEAFAEAGLDVVLFDYRCFGDSDGEPRQLASPAGHRDDYRAAVTFARELDGVDADRIVLWGTSWSGGHVVYVAASDPRIAAIVSQTPDVDGLRTTLGMALYGGFAETARGLGHALRDGYQALRGGRPHLLPIVGDPGELAAITTEEAKPGYLAIAGRGFRNEVPARALIVEFWNRPIAKMDELRCPVLVQVAERDSICPPAAAEAAAWRAKGRVEVRHYGCSHFDIYLGETRARSIADQLHFLRRHLAPSKEPAALPHAGLRGSA
jgi:uncharacterized protein